MRTIVASVIHPDSVVREACPFWSIHKFGCVCWPSSLADVKARLNGRLRVSLVSPNLIRKAERFILKNSSETAFSRLCFCTTKLSKISSDENFSREVCEKSGNLSQADRNEVLTRFLKKQRYVCYKGVKMPNTYVSL